MAFLSSQVYFPTGDDIIDAVTQGSFWALDSSQTIHWTLADGFFGEFWINPLGTIASIEQALTDLEQYIAVDFVYGGYFLDPIEAGRAGSDLVYSLDGSGLYAPPFAWAVGFFPNWNFSPNVAPGYATRGGDMFMNINSELNFLESYEPGSEGYFVFLHETFHALGLKHTKDDAFNRPSLSSIGLGQFDEDWFSVMSYNDKLSLDRLRWDPAAPMAMDVLALQFLYGANMSTFSNDSRHFIEERELYTTIWDAGGVDWVDASRVGEGWYIELPDFVPSSLVPTPVGLTFELSVGDTPRNLTWLMGDLENARGSEYSDVIIGNGLPNILEGGGGNDRIAGLGGNDIIRGGAGIDTAVFTGPAGRYQISILKDQDFAILVSDKRPDGDGLDRLASIEQLEFSDGFSFGADGRVDTSLLLGVTNVSAEELTTFVEMYIAYFDRAPDATGIYYWGSRLADGMTLPEIAASFFVQPESAAIYPDPNDNAKLVDSAYRNLLERGPDAEGREYWIAALNEGDVSRPAFMLAIINGAKAATGSPDDVRVIEDKGKIGLSYAVTNGLTDVNNAIAAMAAYERSDPQASLAEAERLIDAYREAAETATSSELIVELVGFIDDPFG